MLCQKINQARKNLEDILELMKDAVERNDKVSFNDLKPIFYRNYQIAQDLIFTDKNNIIEEEYKWLDDMTHKYAILRRQCHLKSP